jgi:anti-anti-sigma factor
MPMYHMTSPSSFHTTTHSCTTYGLFFSKRVRSQIGCEQTQGVKTAMRKLFLNYQIQHESGIAVLILDGFLDITQTSNFEAKMNDICSGEKPRCVLDLSKLRSINSASLGILIYRIQDVRKLGGDICIGGCSETVEQVFNTFGFKNVFNFFESRQEAIEQFQLVPRE